MNRPIDSGDFNGTVVVEGLNVFGGVDASPDWMQSHVELVRQGYAWVGVSAEAVGLNVLRGRPRWVTRPGTPPRGWRKRSPADQARRG